MSQQTQKELPPPNPTGCAAVLVRLIWMGFGNLALALLALLIIQKGSFSVLDGVFWAMVGTLVVVRYFDVTRLHGLTADGKPASLRHWYRYAFGLLAASGGGWTLAHAAAGFVAP